MEWQPIETADTKPKLILGRYSEPVLLLVDGVAIQGEFDNQDGKWYVERLESHGCGCCAGEDSAPTHWCPLPKLQKQGEDDGSN